MVDIFSYRIKAFVSNPLDKSLLTYEGIVDRDRRLDEDGQIDSLKSGLVHHILKKVGVQVRRDKIVIELVELLSHQVMVSFPEHEDTYVD